MQLTSPTTNLSLMRLSNFLLFLLFSLSRLQGQVVINEVMQSNIDCLMDDMNEFPDSWVELCNVGEAPVNLEQYALGLSADASAAFPLPSYVLAPGGHALVYADKEGTGWHTDFRLDSGKGCTLYLFCQGEVMDQLPDDMAKQPAPNVAFGRQGDGSAAWGYQRVPTPGAANDTRQCQGVLGQPVFSRAGGVFAVRQPLELQISVPEGCPEGTMVRYTTNGSEPTEDSPQAAAPIIISQNTVVRAKLFCEGWLSQRSTTHSYIFHGADVTLPVISLVTDSAYLYDDKLGILAEGTYEAGKRNYRFNWRRPVNFEFFEGEGSESQLNQLCETRVQGFSSRSMPVKSLVVYANKRFGKKHLKYEFFPDQRPEQVAFKSLILRNAGNDFTELYLRDALIQRSMTAHGADLDWQAWRPAIVYLNGAYNGMLNIRERSSADNIFTNYDGLEDIDMIEAGRLLKEGSWDNYEAFCNFYSEDGHTMAEYAEWMDCEEYMNLMAMHLFYANIDFPDNNYVLWRPRAEGGRWRWIAKDTDFGLGLNNTPADINTIARLYNPETTNPQHTLLFRQLMDDEQFRAAFIDRCLIYMGDFMNKQGTIQVWDPMYEAIQYEIPRHRRFSRWWWKEYDVAMADAREWLTHRGRHFAAHLQEQYSLGDTCRLSINAGLSEEDLARIGALAVNAVSVTSSQWSGTFFQNRMLSLDAQTESGSALAGWSVKSFTQGSLTEQFVAEAGVSLVVPQGEEVHVDAILEESGTLTFTPPIQCAEHPEASISAYDLLGRKARTTSKGLQLEKRRKRIFRTP